MSQCVLHLISLLMAVKAVNDTHNGRNDSTMPTIGDGVDIRSFGYMAAIYSTRSSKPIAVGVIITSWYVLSVCHIFINRTISAFSQTNIKEFEIRAANVQFLTEDYVSKTVKDFIQRGNCSTWYTLNDTALMIVNSPFPIGQFDTMQVVSPFSHDPNTIENRLWVMKGATYNCVVLDWGRYVVSKKNATLPRYFYQYSSQLMKIDVFFETNSQCQTKCAPNDVTCSYDYAKPHPQFFCISGSVNYVGPCGVTSGTPLICDGYFLGMHLGTPECSENSHMGAGPGPAAFIGGHEISKFLIREGLNISGSPSVSQVPSFIVSLTIFYFN